MRRKRCKHVFKTVAVPKLVLKCKLTFQAFFTVKSFEGTLSKEESERIYENFAIISQHVEPGTGMLSVTGVLSVTKVLISNKVN